MPLQNSRPSVIDLTVKRPARRMQRLLTLAVAVGMVCMAGCGGGGSSTATPATGSSNGGSPASPAAIVDLGRLGLAGLAAPATLYLDGGDAQVLSESNPYFGLTGTDGASNVTLDVDVATPNDAARRGAQVAVSRADGSVFVLVLSAPVGTTVVTPLTTLADYLTRSGSSPQSALAAVAAAFAIPVADLTAASPTARGRTAQQLAFGALAGYQDMVSSLFESNVYYHARGRAVAASEALSKLPALLSASPSTFSDVAAVTAWLTSKGLFLGYPEFSSAVIAATNPTFPVASVRTLPAAMPTESPSASGDNCPEPDQGLSYPELGRMLLGSSAYSKGLDEHREGVNQLFAGSCGAVFNGVANGWHTGIDYQVGNKSQTDAVRRSVPQFAPVTGEVVYVSPSVATGGMSNYGMVTIRDDRNSKRYWRHLHLDRADVKVGDRVDAGCQIGLSGGTGSTKRDTFPVHAHLEVWEGDLVTAGSASAYQKTWQAVTALGYKNPRLLIDAFTEPHGKPCTGTTSAAAENWTFKGQIVLPTGRLVRSIGFTNNGSIYSVNDLGVIEVFSSSSLSRLKGSTALTGSDYGTSYLPGVYSAAAFKNRVVLGANGANAIPVMDVETLTKVDSYPYAQAKIGKNSLTRTRSMFPESIGFATDGSAVTVFGSGVFTADSKTTGERIGLPGGNAMTNQLAIPGPVCLHGAYRSRAGTEGTIAVSCSGTVSYVASGGTVTTLDTVAAQGGVDALYVGKNGDLLLLSYSTGTTRVIKKYVVANGSGVPVLNASAEFAAQPQYAMYPVMNAAEGLIYVQRYLDFQILNAAGVLSKTVTYPTGVLGVPSSPNARITANADGSLLLVPLSSKVLVYARN